MKKTLIISALGAISLSSSTFASNNHTEDRNWTRTFKLHSGATITRAPDGLTFTLGSIGAFKVDRRFQFFTALSMRGLKPSEDGVLSTQMSAETFRVQVQKFGTIISEQE